MSFTHLKDWFHPFQSLQYQQHKKKIYQWKFIMTFFLTGFCLKNNFLLFILTQNCDQFHFQLLSTYSSIFHKNCILHYITFAFAFELLLKVKPSNLCLAATLGTEKSGLFSKVCAICRFTIFFNWNSSLKHSGTLHHGGILKDALMC